MKNTARDFLNRYFEPALDLRIRLFNVLVLVSGCFCAVIAFVSVFTDAGLAGTVISLVASAFCFALLALARRSERARLCHILFIAGAFFVLFPVLFFRMGGYYGGIPLFLVFAVVFTIFMLEGKTAVIVTALQLALYIGIYIFAYMNPSSVSAFPTERGVFASNMQDLIIVCVALGATMYAQVSLYRSQQRRLDEQNALLAEVNRAKTQFLANASHEMRTPLTIISVNVQTVSDILADMGDAVKDPDADSLLKNAQNEIMRLSRMVDGMLTLASISEGVDKQKTDLSALLLSVPEMLRIHLQGRGNTPEMKIDEGLTVFCDADLISQVVVNLIQNSHKHTEDGIIKLSAARDGGTITVTVSDNGKGISPEMLPRIFERGVSDGGTGFGLYFCKTVVESHGGEMRIESERGKGTIVYFTLPVYEGQGGGEHAEAGRREEHAEAGRREEQ